MIINYLSYKTRSSLIDKVEKKLKSNGFCIIKNFLKKKQHREIYKFLEQSFHTRKDIRQSGPFIYKQKDYKRLDIGDSYVNPKFLRFLTYFEWHRKNNNLYNIIRPVMEFRDHICKIKKLKDYTYEIPGKKNKKYIYCDLIRMIQYPIGGGFLGQHHDKSSYFPPSVLNFLIPLSKKNINSHNGHFETGGLYYISKNKKKMNIEKYLDVGDVIVHNQSISHGVTSIDPHKDLDLKKFSGRLTLNFSIGNFIK